MIVYDSKLIFDIFFNWEFMHKYKIYESKSHIS